MLDFGRLGSHIRQNEERFVADALGEEFLTLVGEVDRVQDFVDYEVKRVCDDRHFLLVVLHIIVLRLLHNHLHTGLAQILDERLVFREALVGAQKELSAFGFVAFGHLLLRFVQNLVHQSPLSGVQFLHIGPELHILFVVLRFRHRTGDDERSTRIVDEHGVHLVHDCVVMLALHEIVFGCGHVITQIIEAEFVVSTEGDVAVVGLLAVFGVGLMLVDTVHAEAVEHVERPHPLGVSLGQIVVHRNHVNTLAGKRIQEHGEGRDEGLTLTCGHLGYLSLMQGDTADQLHVVVHHIPLEVVTSGHPVVPPDRFVPLDGKEVPAFCG